MTTIQDWAVQLCTVGIACSLLSVLCPKGATRRVFSVLTAVFFFSCFLVPVKTLVQVVRYQPIIREQADVSTVLQNEVDRQTEEVLAKVLLQDARARVGESATVKAVAVVRDKTRSDNIYIEKITVTLDKQDRAVAKTVCTMLEQAWGRRVEVYYVQ